jgi:excisionase family DNA binding protein
MATSAIHWITIGEVARRLGISTGTVLNWVEKGVLPRPVRHGDRDSLRGRSWRRWDAAVIDAFLAGHKGGDHDADAE